MLKPHIKNSGTIALALALIITLQSAAGSLDKTKYITIDEIKPGMPAYCLTTYKGNRIEKFDLEVLSVMHNIKPGHNAILVQGTGKQFIHTGPVAGCSGSPVYIDNRLAGALAFGWTYSKDPLYGVTPIKEMLDIKTSNQAAKTQAEPYLGIDYSMPIDFDRIERKLSNPGETSSSGNSNASGPMLKPLACPIIVSSLPAHLMEKINSQLQPLHLLAVTAPVTSSDTTFYNNISLEPGDSVAVPLVAGDISMPVIGTVTDVTEAGIYAFGHGFLGYGRINLPLATSNVHTVVSNVYRSFKLGSADKIIGTLLKDESTAVFGKIGEKPEMIPLTISVNRYNEPEKQIYNCRIAKNKTLTPKLFSYTVLLAALTRGELPPEHNLKYEINIHLDDFPTVAFDNISSSLQLNQLSREAFASLALLMNNPYQNLDLKALDFHLDIEPENVLSHIWSVELSDSRLNPSDTLTVSAVIESWLGDKRQYDFQFELPPNLAPGKYKLIVTGGPEYENFIRETTPYKFIPENIESLIECINLAANIKRDKLHCILLLPNAGLALHKSELPDLPPTKTLILNEVKRAVKTQQQPRWLEKSTRTGSIIVDSKIMQITIKND